jgi:demethylmenaquinone methyltransferase/2-methoxy-6-polyprenyl-1,4-benzoquinol methylase
MAPSPASEVVAFPPGGEAKRSYVRRMFTAIAPRYDLLNHLLSFNIDRRWRRAAVRRHGRVLGADFVVPMLERGRGKAARAVPVAADALQLPFPNASFDGALVAFGLRNLADPDAGLAEAARVLRPGARFVVLEFTTPRFAPLRAAFLFYFRHILPAIGRAVSKHRDAYTYLPESVAEWSAPEALAARFVAAGFRDTGYELLTAGICALHYGTR